MKGHHTWVSKDASDGWCSCIDSQKITLHFLDETELELTGGMSGSGCSGGDADSVEPGRLFIARRTDTLIDLDSVESISICGVNIPLRG